MNPLLLVVAALTLACSSAATRENSAPKPDAEPDPGADAATGDSGALGDAGSEAGPDASIESQIEAFCQKLADLPCGKSKQQCVDDALALIDEAADKGCSGEYSALLRCAAEGSAECSGAGGVVLPDCQSELAALDACDPPSAGCVGADVPGVSCSKSCSDWGAACSETPQGLECSCTVGPHAGEQFTLPGTCLPSWATEAQAKCD